MHYICFIIIIFLLIIPLIIFKGSNPNNIISENFTNENNIKTLIPANIPSKDNLKGSKFNVIKYRDQGGNNLVPNEGKFRFRKQELLYDGIWGAEYNKDYKICNWKNKSPLYPLKSDNNNLIYGSNKYLILPKKDMENKEIILPKKKLNNKRMEYYKNNKLNRLKKISENSEVSHLKEYHYLENFHDGFSNSVVGLI